MAKHRIECYLASSGCVVTFAWGQGEKKDYLRSKAFLEELGASASTGESGASGDFSYLADDRQRDAFYSFLKKLKDERRLRAR